ncbi:HD domain [Dehalogenimonas alkenigignens]|uniref:HD domain n=1 Tax=Dehalogenimonas alkenigignens TaxID=1217799 RepID=A0A0W0GFV7_9CHLR|nr:HD domain-containing phosphohydrolase [Dehalogenimonas alkenigignens]KTB47425.1 HD domain [Dehalogenimonas alkenigignens]
MNEHRLDNRVIGTEEEISGSGAQKTFATEKGITSLPGAIGVQELLDSMPFYVLLVDSDHHIVGANKAFCARMRLDFRDVIGAYCPKLVHGVDHFNGCPLEDVVRMEVQGPVEKEYQDPRSKHWIKAAIYPTGRFTEAGKPIYLHTVRDITEHKLTALKLEKQHRLRGAIQEILNLSLKDVSLEELLSQALGIIISAPGLTIESKGAIFLVEDDPQVLVMKAQAGLDLPVKEICSKVPFGKCLCGIAASSQAIQFTQGLDDKHEFRYPEIKEHGHYCLPMVSNGTTLGVINVYLKEGHQKDSEEESFLVSASDALSGVVLRKKAELNLTQTLSRLQRTFKQTIVAISKANEEVDPYTAGHQRRVAQLSSAIASEMGLSSDRVEGIEVAGLVHDFGKVAIPSSILAKPGRLNEFEMGLVRIHSKIGYEILKEVDFPWPIAQMVLQHHERLNGSGYPDGLTGDAILEEAKILAVADVFEAMSSHRPYRPALGVSAALNEIMSQKSVLYDPKVADTLLKLVVEKDFKFSLIE